MPNLPEEKVKLYGGKVEVVFNRERHTYLVNGEKAISVTACTGLLAKPALVFWSANLARDFLLEHLKNGNTITEEMIVEAAKQHTQKAKKEATSGTLVHEWASRYIKGEKPEMPEDERVIRGVTAFLDWVKESKVKFLATEQWIYSMKHDYVGTMDCKFTMGPEKHKVIHCGDFKTSSGFYNEMRYQVAAYQEADAEESGCEYGNKWIIRFDKNDGTFEAKEFGDHEKDFGAFLGLLAAKRRELELKV